MASRQCRVVMHNDEREDVTSFWLLTIRLPASFLKIIYLTVLPGAIFQLASACLNILGLLGS